MIVDLYMGYYLSNLGNPNGIVHRKLYIHVLYMDTLLDNVAIDRFITGVSNQFYTKKNKIW